MSQSLMPSCAGTLTTAAEISYTSCMIMTAEPPIKQETDLEAVRDARGVLIQSLLAQGAIPFIPEGRSGSAPYPVPVRGEPVSETIIAERR